jgi:anti-sigma factor RsiW
MSSPENGGAPDLMSAYLDDQLDGEQAAAFEDYLESSADAREELDELRRVVALVSGLPGVEPPPDFYETLSKKLRRRPSGPDAVTLTLISLPFQVLSILVILTVAALYMMAELERAPQGGLERDPPPTAPAPETDGPRPVVP